MNLSEISSELRIAGVEGNDMHFVFRESVDKYNFRGYTVSIRYAIFGAKL